MKLAHAGARSVRTRHALDKAADEDRLTLRICSVNDCAAGAVVRLYGPDLKDSCRGTPGRCGPVRGAVKRVFQVGSCDWAAVSELPVVSVVIETGELRVKGQGR